MICPPCQLAGEYNAQGVNAPETVAPALFFHAEAEHKKCRNNDVKPANENDPASDKSRLTTWCDCQHAVGVYLNSSLIREAEGNTNATVE